MRIWIAATVAFVSAVTLGSEVLSACGDKFLLVGRGVRFQKAYAAIHPATVLVVLPPKNTKSAVLDPRLVDALKMAGHKVKVVQQPANLAEVLERTPHDIVLATRADAVAIPAAVPGGRAAPSVVAVLDRPSAAELAAAQQQVQYVLKAPQPLTQILNLLDDVMKTRKVVRTPALSAE